MSSYIVRLYVFLVSKWKTSTLGGPLTARTDHSSVTTQSLTRISRYMRDVTVHARDMEVGLAGCSISLVAAARSLCTHLHWRRPTRSFTIPDARESARRCSGRRWWIAFVHADHHDDDHHDDDGGGGGGGGGGSAMAAAALNLVNVRPTPVPGNIEESTRHADSLVDRTWPVYGRLGALFWTCEVDSFGCEGKDRYGSFR